VAKTNPQIWRELTATGLDFLHTELRTASTFTRIAANAPAHSPRKARNQASARIAYNKVKELRGRLQLSDSDLQDINKGLDRLKSALEDLGEEF
jgi:hypothetical protein